MEEETLKKRSTKIIAAMMAATLITAGVPTVTASAATYWENAGYSDKTTYLKEILQRDGKGAADWVWDEYEADADAHIENAGEFWADAGFGSIENCLKYYKMFYGEDIPAKELEIMQQEIAPEKPVTMYVSKATSSYKERSTKSQKVNKLKKGDAITVVKPVGSYYKLDDGSYVLKSKVSDKLTSWTLTKYSKTKTFYVAKNKVSTLKSALPDGKTAKTLKKGAKVTVKGVTNTGYYQLKDGTFIAKSDVSKTKPATSASYKAPSASAKSAGTGIKLKASEGKVFNIMCWNDEFKNYFEKYYKVPKGVKVNWIINPSYDNGYQIPLDYALANQSSTPKDERIDLFLAEPDYIDKYVESKYVMDLSKIGVKPYSTEYMYLIEGGLNSKNQYKAVGFQAYPALLLYNRLVAEQVLGTSDPAEVQKKLDTMNELMEAAEIAKEKGYYLFSGPDDMLRMYCDNMLDPMVDKKNNFKLDEGLIQWAKLTKEMTEKGYHNQNGIWTWGWSEDMAKSGRYSTVMCYYGSSWFYNYTMKGNGAPDGTWGVVEAPMTSTWGGTYMLAASGSDNPQMLADVMNAFTANTSICKKLAKDELLLPNNKTAAKALSKTYKNEFLGGQNDLKVQMTAADNITYANKTKYDLIIVEQFSYCMKDYFNGYVTYEDALENFYNNIQVYYPELKIKK